MKLTMCACGAEHLERIPRSWWMRLFTSRRHYQCSRCGATMFVRKPPPRVNAMVAAAAGALHTPPLAQRADPVR